MGKLKVKIVTLTKSKAVLYDLVKNINAGDANNVWLYMDTEMSVYNTNNVHDATWIPQHMFFVVDSAPQIGDWFLDVFVNELVPCRLNEGTATNSTMKIVATTDLRLDLPIINKPFIEAYAESCGEIEHVMLELENGKIKIRKNGTVIISKIKDSWSRSEVDQIIRLTKDIEYLKYSSEEDADELKSKEIELEKLLS